MTVTRQVVRDIWPLYAAGDVTDLAAVREYIDAARAPWS